MERTVQLIKNYAQNYETMSDETAEKLLSEMLAIDKDHLKLKENFLPKFHKVLPAKLVARYYQIENKIDAVNTFGLAAQIPLVK